MSHGTSGYGREAGIVVRTYDAHGRPDGWKRHEQKFRAYWDSHAPIVRRLVDRAETTMLVDPGEDDNVWAFACREAGVVHMAVVKRRFAEFGPAMLDQLLSGSEGAVATHEMQDVHAAYGGKNARGWTYDSYWIARNT